MSGKRTRLWIVLSIAVIAATTTGLLLGGAAADETSVQRDGVFIHISHGAEDPHQVLMALNMAAIMAEDRDVLVYFDIKAVRVVLADAEDLQYKQFPALKKQLASLPKQGVTLMACPGCLAAADKTAADLAPGIQIADKDTFFSFTQGRILTLDY